MSCRSLEVLESSLFHLRISISSLKKKVCSKELDSIQLKECVCGFSGRQGIDRRSQEWGPLSLSSSHFPPFKYLFINSVKSIREFSAPRGLAFLTSVKTALPNRWVSFIPPCCWGWRWGRRNYSSELVSHIVFLHIHEPTSVSLQDVLQRSTH